MADKLKTNETYYLSKDVFLLLDKEGGAEFSVSTGTPLTYMGKKKVAKGVNLLFRVQNGNMNVSIPEQNLTLYVHDSIVEQVRKAEPVKRMS